MRAWSKSRLTRIPGPDWRWVACLQSQQSCTVPLLGLGKGCAAGIDGDAKVGRKDAIRTKTTRKDTHRITCFGQSAFRTLGCFTRIHLSPTIESIGSKGRPRLVDSSFLAPMGWAS